MWLDYFFTNCVKSPKFSEVIFKKHNLKVYANCVQCILDCCFGEGVYHDSSWFSRKRLFALQMSYNS